jgi:hypothetical protein
MQDVPDDDETLKRMSDLENAAEDVEHQKRLLVELDRRSNMLREGARALKDEVAASKNPKLTAKREVWLLSSGGVFLRTTGADAIVHMSEDTRRTKDMVEEGRDELKRRVCGLAELEGPDSALHHLYQGFDLHPVNKPLKSAAL